MNHHRSNMYRFVLYGRSGSGKTCVLATMARGATGHPGELSCVRLPIEEPKPSNDLLQKKTPTEWTQGERTTIGLHGGKDWIDQAVQALDRGEAPKLNPVPEPDAPPSIVDFNIGSPHRGEIRVRTIDYSGELINPESVHDPESDSNALQRYLREFDGFLVLGEVPRTDQQSNVTEDGLTRLKEAFAALRETQEEAGEAPLKASVAVIFTKWDRRLPANGRLLPDDMRESLRRFLDEQPAHRALVTGIQCALAEQEPVADEPNHELQLDQWGLRFGNCAVFPSSAFGNVEVKEGQECPARDGTPFGLLDAFLWLADRRDALDEASLREELAELHPVWDGLPWRFWRYSTLSKRARLRLARMPKKSAVATRTREVGRRAFFRFWTALAVWIAASLLVFDLGNGGYSCWQFANQVAIVGNPRTPEERLTEAHTWFEKYRQRGWQNGVLIAPTPEDADKEKRRIDRKIEERYWAPVENAKNLEEEAKAARVYLTKLPNGERAKEATQIIGKRDAERDDREWEPVEKAEESSEKARQAEIYLDNFPEGQREEKARTIIARWRDQQKTEHNKRWLAVQEAATEGALRSGSMDQVRQDLQGGFPHPELVSLEMERRRGELDTKVQKELDRILLDKDWQEFVSTYHETLKKFDFGSCASLLTGRQPQDPHWGELVKAFPKEVQKALEKRVEVYIEDHRFRNAKDEIEEGEKALKELEDFLRPTSPELADHIQGGIQELQPMLVNVAARWDQHLYDQFRSRRTLETAQRYLDTGPQKTMEQHVRGYQQYLHAIQQPLNLTLSVKIYWHKDYDAWVNSHRHELRVTLDDVTNLNQNNLQSVPGEVSGIVGQITREAELRDKVRVIGSISRAGKVYGQYQEFAGSRILSFEDLRSEQSIQLKGNKGAPYHHEMRLQIASGVDQEPRLPLWEQR